MNLASVWAWLSAHAVLILVGWPIFTALVNLVFGAADKYALTHPRFHAALSVLESAGFDARGTISAIAKLLASKTGVVVDAGKKAGAVVFVLIGLGALAATQPACTPQVQQDVVNSITPAAACVINIVEDVTGTIDIGKTAATCGVTVQDIIKIVQELIAGEPDAAVSDAALGSSARRDRLLAWYRAAQGAR